MCYQCINEVNILFKIASLIVIVIAFIAIYLVSTITDERGFWILTGVFFIIWEIGMYIGFKRRQAAEEN